MRLFFAVNLPVAVRDAIHYEVRALRELRQGVRWTDAENLHYTVKFLGEQSDDRVVLLTDAVQAVAARHRPFDLEPTGVGGFPNLRDPRVVWLGVRHDEAFVALAHDVDEACVALGLDAEHRLTRAHLTLGRVKQRLGPAESALLQRTAPRVRSSQRIPVRSVDLVRSQPGRDGSHYTVLARLTLGTPTPKDEESS